MSGWMGDGIVEGLKVVGLTGWGGAGVGVPAWQILVCSGWLAAILSRSRMGSEVRVRFAPSPTGYLHVGGARTALFNWLFARHSGGRMVLRVEDTDRARSTEEAVHVIGRGLEWLGIDWDEGPGREGDYGPYFQSQRDGIYARHLAKLEGAGCVYEDKGAIRFRSTRQPVVVDDVVCGRIEFERTTEPDMTIRRPDGSWIFHFVSVVDDIEMRISHVIRGEDHLSNTPKHVELYKALGATPPVFAHIPLILNPNGSKMSKRDEGASITSYIEEGYAPEAVRNYLCLLGWSPKDDREKLEIEEVIRLFDLEGINRANASFDIEKCRWLNYQYLSQMNFDRYRELSKPFLNRAGVKAEPDEYLAQVLGLVQEKVKLLRDIPDWVGYFFDEDYAYDTPSVEKRLGDAAAFDRLLSLGDCYRDLEPWEAGKLEEALKLCAADLECKPAALIHPARVAVSGKSVGPSLYHMLEVMGKDRVLSRFNRTIEQLRPS